MRARFLPPKMAEKYGLDLPVYPGVDQIVEVSAAGAEGEEEL